MNYLQRLEHWGDAHHPRYLDFVRMAFGVFLLFKGIEFARQFTLLNETIGRHMHFNSLVLLLLGHYVIFAHILGGFLIAVGLLTRFACLIQIPVLLGAIFFINTDFGNQFPQLLLSLVALAGLVYFMVIGSGPLSLNRTMFKDDKP